MEGFCFKMSFFEAPIMGNYNNKNTNNNNNKNSYNNKRVYFKECNHV